MQQYPTYPDLNGPFQNTQTGGYYYTDAQGNPHDAGQVIASRGVPNTSHYGGMMPQQPMMPQYGGYPQQPMMPQYGGYPQPPMQYAQDTGNDARSKLRQGNDQHTTPQGTQAGSHAPNQPANQHAPRQPTANGFGPGMVRANSLTKPYVEGRVLPKFKVAHYRTSHGVVALTNYDGVAAEYIYEKEKVPMEINNHLVAEEALFSPAAQHERLGHGGAITRRHVPENYPMIDATITGETLSLAVNAARISCIVKNDGNVIMPSEIQTVICPAPKLTDEQVRALEDLNLQELPQDVTIDEIAEAARRLHTRLVNLNLHYAARWLNEELLSLANHILVNELNCGYELENDAIAELPLLADAFINIESAQQWNMPFATRFAFLVRNQLGTNVTELYNGDSDVAVKALTRTLSPLVVTLNYDLEARDIEFIGTKYCSITDGHLFEDIAPTTRKIVEESVLNVLGKGGNTKRYAWYILNTTAGYAFEVYAYDRPQTGWSFYIKRIAEN